MSLISTVRCSVTGFTCWRQVCLFGHCKEMIHMTESTHPADPTQPEGALPEPAEGCGWQGRAFGAHYPDGCCIEGMLWDLDSCDEPGGGLTSGGDRCCPNCNAEGCADNMTFSGNARQRRAQRKAAILEIQEGAKAETAWWAR